MMKLYSVNVQYQKKSYSLHKTFGFLLEKNKCDKTKGNLAHISKMVDYAINQVKNPYIQKSNIYSHNKQIKCNKKLANILAKIYTLLCSKSFIFVRLLSCFRFNIFDTTEDAILYYRKLFQGDQQKLCLPRALFAATTSKSFKNKGVIFIGAFLPSRAMHAWIIEEERQPDPFDDIWICYQPLAVLYKQ